MEEDSADSLLFSQPVFFDELEPHHKQMRDTLIPPELNYHGLVQIYEKKKKYSFNCIDCEYQGCNDTCEKCREEKKLKRD